MTKPLIFQIVGYSNSGKTTLITKWLEKLSKKSIKAATIKHHGHKTPLISNDVGKDSNDHRKAGALGSLVVNDNSLQWTMKLEQPLELDEILPFYQRFSMDVLIVEGFKKERYPKLVLLRGEEDMELIEECIGVEAVVCWEQEQQKQLQTQLSCPVFWLYEQEAYLSWLEKRLESQEG